MDRQRRAGEDPPARRRGATTAERVGVSRCERGCSWRARLAVAGTNGNGHTLPRSMLPRLAELLPLVPVRCFFDGEVLRHPGVERDRNGAPCRIAPIEPAQIVGVVERV